MDWLHCNSCAATPREKRKLFFSSCSHVVCAVCLQKDDLGGKCKVCSKDCKVIEVGPSLPRNIINLFRPPKDLASEVCSKMSKNLNFQKFHRENLAAHQKKTAQQNMEKIKKTKDEMAKLTEQKKIIDAEMDKMQRKLQVEKDDLEKMEQILEKKKKNVERMKVQVANFSEDEIDETVLISDGGLAEKRQHARLSGDNTAFDVVSSGSRRPTESSGREAFKSSFSSQSYTSSSAASSISSRHGHERLSLGIATPLNYNRFEEDDRVGLRTVPAVKCPETPLLPGTPF